VTKLIVNKLLLHNAAQLRAQTLQTLRGAGVIRVRGDGGQAVLALAVCCVCSVDRLNARLRRGVGRQKREN
jgi:hypothetical protein